jgi:hypothetical protein
LVEPAAGAEVSYRDENIRYLRPLWIRFFGIWALLIVLAVAMMTLLSGDYWGPLFAAFVVAFSLAYIRLRRRSLGRNALRAPSPDTAARLLFGPIAGRIGNNARPFLVTGTANIHVVYGGFERAEELLASIDWTDKPPLLRGDALIVRAMMDYLRGDYAAGLAKARDIPALMEVPKLAPGAKTTQRSAALLVDIGLALAEHDVGAIERLRQAPSFKRHIVLRAVAAWTLWKIGDAQGERWLAVSRELMPHAYGLGAQQPAFIASAAATSANPYAAPSTVASADTPYDPLVEVKRARWVRVGLWLSLAAMFFVIYWLLGVTRH